jgi:ATP-dependent Clp protease ATP-binding subunit ClpA
VEDALRNGSSFGAVARAMNISRQAAHRRYRDLVPAPRLALSSHARRAVQLAREEAHAMAAPDLAGEHLLLGVVRSGGPAARALEAEGVTADATRACIVPSEGAVAGAALLQRAAGIAAARDASEVEADHLVLAALSDPHGGATRAITALGVTPAAVRARLGC